MRLHKVGHVLHQHFVIKRIHHFIKKRLKVVVHSVRVERFDELLKANCNLELVPVFKDKLAEVLNVFEILSNDSFICVAEVVIRCSIAI